MAVHLRTHLHVFPLLLLALLSLSLFDVYRSTLRGDPTTGYEGPVPLIGTRDPHRPQEPQEPQDLQDPRLQLATRAELRGAHESPNHTRCCTAVRSASPASQWPAASGVRPRMASRGRDVQDIDVAGGVAEYRSNDDRCGGGTIAVWQGWKWVCFWLLASGLGGPRHVACSPVGPRLRDEATLVCTAIL